MSDARLILLPGMGVDARLFVSQRAAFPRLEVPTWLSPEPDETLERYGARMARRIVVGPGEPLYLGGASFGGMVAQEMARALRPRAVFLIASCRSGDQIAGFTRWIERVSRPIPDAALRAGQRWLHLLLPDLLRLPANRQGLFLAMVRDASLNFIRWATRAALNWAPHDQSSVPVHHIHGQRDTLIPVTRVHPDRIVPGVGHLLTMSCSAEVNRFIRERIERLEHGT
jgi:pimeloyl-ACP methyl ester carboxylesterase